MSRRHANVINIEEVKPRIGYWEREPEAGDPGAK